MNNITKYLFVLLLSIIIYPSESIAQSVVEINETITIDSLNYVIKNRKLKILHENQKKQAIKSSENILFALDRYFKNSTTYSKKNIITINKKHINLVFDNMDTIQSAVYCIVSQKPLSPKKQNHYESFEFHQGTPIPHDDFVLFKNPNTLLIVSIFFNAIVPGTADSIQKENKQKAVLDWYKNHYKCEGVTYN